MSIIIHGTRTDNTDLLTSRPSFSATLSATQTVSASTYTKIAYATEHWDTDSKYDASSYIFTPTVAGYYEFIIGTRNNSSTTNIVALYKNGVLFRRGVSSGQQYARLSIMQVANTTDYFEAYGFTTGTQFLNTADDTYFQAHFVRGA
tara:strand:+ start:11 stop:451 length:441 start_codon:yes stop_codon:yes gene_type:complete